MWTVVWPFECERLRRFRCRDRVFCVQLASVGGRELIVANTVLGYSCFVVGHGDSGFGMKG